MRITTNMLFNRNELTRNTIQGRLEHAYYQSTTGERLRTAADDPAAKAKGDRLTTEIDLLKQYGQNSVILKSSLALEEATLTSVNDALERARVLSIRAQNGSLQQTELEGIAAEVASIRQEVFDLMNSKDASGNFIFAGHQSQIQPFVFNAGSGSYDFVGDSGESSLQLGSNVFVQQNDSGAKVFQAVANRNFVSTAAANLTITTVAQRQFDNFHDANYDYVTPANNTYSFNTIAGTPDKYEIRDSGGALLSSGDYTPGVAVDWQGIRFIDNAAVGSSSNFTLDPPSRDNVLNKLLAFEKALKDPTLTDSGRINAASDMQYGMEYAQTRVMDTVAEIGARVNTIDRMADANSGFSIVAQEARADATEADYAKAITDLNKEKMLLETSYGSFAKISALNLFQYIR